MRWMAEVERRGEYCPDDHGRAAARWTRGVVCDLGEHPPTAVCRRGLDSLWMVAMPVVGSIVGTECALDARGLLRSCSATFPRLEEVAGWADREMVP